MTTLIIARHGNTFEPSETPRRVGARTDLPLTEKGRDQARSIGKYLKDNRLIPDVVYSSVLQRTHETAKIAIRESGVTNPVYQIDIFNEIDYGPDENKTEEDVIARIGHEAIERWNKEGIVPDGWAVEPDEIIQNWIGFAEQHTPPLPNPPPRGGTEETAIAVEGGGETILVVTSNGVARFAPHITGDFESFAAQHDLKLSTGALAIFEFADGTWHMREWNLKP